MWKTAVESYPRRFSFCFYIIHISDSFVEISTFCNMDSFSILCCFVPENIMINSQIISVYLYVFCLFYTI